MEIIRILIYILFFIIIVFLSIQTIKYFLMMWKYKNTPKEDRKDDFFYFD